MSSERPPLDLPCKLGIHQGWYLDPGPGRLAPCERCNACHKPRDEAAGASQAYIRDLWSKSPGGLTVEQTKQWVKEQLNLELLDPDRLLHAAR